jgi:ATP-binding cassette subfamily C (CFTR/MRP) protein 1
MVHDNAQIVIGDLTPAEYPHTAPIHSFSPSRQPFCGDSEGWGPISPIRFDFTPCFLDVWILSVAVWGLLFGAGALWYLLRKKAAQLVPKNWHFHAKLVSYSIKRSIVDFMGRIENNENTLSILKCRSGETR